MAHSAMLLLHGGGAFGAYECGVYKALVPHLRSKGQRLAVVAGASSGAISCAIIARHSDEPDGGAGALEAFWQSLAFPNGALFPVDSLAGRWHGLLSNFLLGNPSLYQPNWASWTPLLSPWRFDLPLFNTEPMRQTLMARFGRFDANPGQSPRLVVRALEIESGNPVAFDSWQEPITVDHLLASAAVPLMFPARRLNGVFHWDGEMSSHTTLRETLGAMQATSPHDDEPYTVFMVDVFPKNGDLPRSQEASTYRLLCAAMGDRAEYDRKFCQRVDEQLAFVDELSTLAQDLPHAGLRVRIEQERDRLQAESRARLDFIVVKRDPLPHEHISRDLDYSVERISALIAQGHDDARRAFAGDGDGSG